MDPATYATTIASQGLLGVMLIIVMYVAWSKDKQLTDERNARITDAKGYNDLALKLQSQVIETVNKLADIFDEIKKLTPRGGGR